ncbi:MAG: hypothetical protein L3J74_18555 [Bacteroidales bacterium]|nr:hypothetical protein [Bacteroidales bacterium]
MKKDIIKFVIGLVFVVGAIVSFNTQTKANVPPQKWGDVACSYTGGGCLLCDGSFWEGQIGLGKYC